MSNMRYWTLIVLLMVFFASCANDNPIMQGVKQDSVDRQAVIKDSIRNVDSFCLISWHKDIVRHIDELNIPVANEECYRLYYYYHFTKFFIISVYCDKGNSILSAKYISDIPDTNSYAELYTTLDSSKQILSKIQADSFRTLMNKSKYWTITTPDFKPEIRDGGFVDFESLSNWRSNDTLLYHSFSSIGIPDSLKPAWGYIISLSKLNVRNKNAPYDIIMGRQ